MSTYSGTGKEGQEDGELDKSSFHCPIGLDFDERDGSLYVVDYKRIRKISGN